MEEPSGLVRWTIYFFASGHSATCGAILTALVLTVALKSRSPCPSVIFVGLSLGLFLIFCGSPAVPDWYFILTVGWLVTLLIYWIRFRIRSKKSDLKRNDPQDSSDPITGHLQPELEPRIFQLGDNLMLASPLVWLLTGLSVELPYQIWRPVRKPASCLMVIGDSVTAGLNDGEMTWPNILPQKAKVEVFDASQPGATLQSALQQNELFADTTGLLVLEIGGNDLLEGLPVDQFERNLDRLLAEVRRSKRMIVMFELPLPPLCDRYGAIQRRLANHYHVHLIPKQYFAQVLTTSGATVDGIHLSASGQFQMARLIEALLADGIEPGTGICRHLGP